MEKQFDKLRESVKRSHASLEDYRKNRLQAVKQYVGTHYTTGGGRQNVPVNLIELAVNIYTQHLAARAPQVRVVTSHIGFRDAAEEFQYALNEIILRIRLEDTLRAAVIGALFGAGIVKVGVTGEDRAEFDGFLHDGNTPFVDNVDLDDWVYESGATRWDQARFFGNKYEVDLEDVKSNSANDRKAVKELHDEFNGKKGEVAEISRSMTPLHEDSYGERVTLWDIWVPREQKIYTFGSEDARKPLRVTDWEGPENGPYHMLGFAWVPNNFMPLPPVASWRDMHDLTNKLYNKLGEQAARQKTVTAVSGNAVEDGQRITRSGDGQVIRVNSPEGIKEIRFGGADQATLAFAIHASDRFSYLSGNLDTLGGLSTGADTLGQEKLLAGSASQRMSSMQGAVIRFTKNVLTDTGWWLWNDPLVQIPVVRRIEGTDNGAGQPIEVETGWPYQMDGQGGEVDIRRGEYNSYNLDIKPESMTDRTSGQQLAMLRQIWAEDILPIIPMLHEQGIGANVRAYLRRVGQYGDLPELDELLNDQIQVNPMDSPAVERPRQAPVTTRNYNRRDITPRQGDNQQQQMMAQLMGQGGAA